MTKRFLSFAAFLLLFAINIKPATAQWNMDLRYQMEIPDVINLESSESHLYALSESEGLVVFRAQSDSLQWLYSSTGMQRRGNVLDSDIRFAYLYGNGRRLTVVEPTSVLGVYSSTVLPNEPRSTKRVGNSLYIALGEGGLGRLSLESPESVDSDIVLIDQDRFQNSMVNDLAADQNQILYVLNGTDKVDIYTISSEDEEAVVEHQEQVNIDRNTHKIFLTANELIGADRNGDIYMINSDGRTTDIASVENPVEKLQIWDELLVVQTENNELWIGPLNDNLTLWRDNGRAGNYFTVTENQLWVSEFNNVAPVVESQSNNSENRSNSSSTRLAIKEINDIVIPFPRPLILPIELEGNSKNVSFSYEASFTNARIRGNSFYWQPSATQTGRHQVEIIATTSDGQTDTQTFTIDLRPFNSPPRFSSTRPITIPNGEEFEIDIKAVDPDGMNTNLIRYLGVDMPNGAKLNEKTGRFTWNPTIRQVGNHEFQVVATDQFGAASSQDFEIRVVEMPDEPDLNEDGTIEVEN